MQGRTQVAPLLSKNGRMEEYRTIKVDESDRIRGNGIHVIVFLVLFSILWTLLYAASVLPPVTILTLVIALLIIVALWARPTVFHSQLRIGRLIPLSILAAIFFFLCYYFTTWLLHRYFPYALQKWEVVISLRERYGLLSAAILFGAVAVGEELFWRGYIQEFLARRFGRDHAIFAAALLFAGIHIPANAPVLFLVAFLAAVYWGWLYARTKTIWLTIIAHALWAISVECIVPFGYDSADRYVSLLQKVLCT